MQSWGPPAPPAAPPSGAMNLGRYASALKRYKWLIVIMTLILMLVAERMAGLTRQLAR